jgi:CIC family chloride channel protein
MRGDASAFVLWIWGFFGCLGIGVLRHSLFTALRYTCAMSLRMPRLFADTTTREIVRMLSLAAAVGMIAGLGAVTFHLMASSVSHVALDWLAGYRAGGPAGEGEVFDVTGQSPSRLRPWLLVIVPTIGGLISGFLVFKLAPEAEGHGTDSAIDAYHNKAGMIRPRVPLVKMIASAITLGTGGSGGREGPIAQIGAGFGSFLASRLKLSEKERRILLAAGMGGGIAAIFHAPLAGAIFAIEVLYRDPDFEAEALIPGFISATVGYCVFSVVMSIWFGIDAFVPLFDVSEGIRFRDPMLLIPLTALAAVMVIASWFYVRCFYLVNARFISLRVPNMLKPAIGACLTGVLALAMYYAFDSNGDRAGHDSLAVLSAGYGYLQQVLRSADGSTLMIGVLIAVGLGKILTTSLTIGSGGSGGVFGPSMVIGGTLGAAVGMVFKEVMPGAPVRVDVFAILGMASFFAAAANTPVSTLIMVSELTASYELLLPSMWVCALAYVFGGRWTMYRKQVANRLESPAHRGDFIIDVLEGMQVADALRPGDRSFTSVPEGMSLGEIVHMITDTKQSCFPVVDANGAYRGLFGLADVRQFLYETGGVSDLAVAQDLASPDVEPLQLQTDLGSAIGRFAQGRFEELPVVDADAPHTVVGLIRRQDVIAAYSSRLVQLRQDEAEA